MAVQDILIANAFPTTTNEEELYVTAADEEILGQVVICNQDSAPQRMSLAVTFHSGAADPAEWNFKEMQFPANGTLKYGVVFGRGNTIRVKVETPSTFSFSLMGRKKQPVT